MSSELETSLIVYSIYCWWHNKFFPSCRSHSIFRRPQNRWLLTDKDPARFVKSNMAAGSKKFLSAVRFRYRQARPWLKWVIYWRRLYYSDRDYYNTWTWEPSDLMAQDRAKHSRVQRPPDLSHPPSLLSRSEITIEDQMKSGHVESFHPSFVIYILYIWETDKYNTISFDDIFNFLPAIVLGKSMMSGLLILG